MSRSEEEEEEEEEGRSDGVWEAYNLCLGFVPCMVAKAVCELGVPDILAHHQHPLSALHIAQLLRPPPTRPLHEVAHLLDRMLACLSASNVFQAHVLDTPASHIQPHDSPVTYSLTPVSKCLQGATSLHSFLLLHAGSRLQDPWQICSQSVLHAGHDSFTAAHSMDIWALAATDPAFNALFNAGMASASCLSVRALLKHYDGFQNGVATLVDVGGGTGSVASSIAGRHPSIRVINFDLPTVIDTAPMYPGVQHISGDMFQSIPPTDAIFMKCTLHDWDDEDSIKILDNCHKALPRHGGKLIIMEAVLDFPSIEKSSFQNVRFAYDMLMLAYTTSGKERTKKQWEVLLAAAKFSIHRIIDLPCPQCLIEAIPLQNS